MVLLEMKN